MSGFRSAGGFALVYALIIVLVVAILAAGSIVTANMARSVAVNDRAALLAQQFAEAGINRFKTLAATSHRYMLANFDEYELPGAGTSGYCLGRSIIGMGIDLDFDHTIDIHVGVPYEFRMNLPDGTAGGYQVLLASGGEQLIVRGFLGPSLADARAVSTRALRYAQEGGLPFSYAIFVRGGFTGPTINGNVAVYGSVHSVRGPLELDDTGLLLSGAAGVYDDYRGKNGVANTDISSLITGLGGNPNIDSLCARVMLQSGNLHIQSGSVHVGTEANRALGVYLAEGFGITGQSQNVYVETPQLVSRYGAGPDFPELDEWYPNEPDVDAVDLIPSGADTACNNFFTTGSPPVLRIPPARNADTAFVCDLGHGRGMIEWEPSEGNGANRVPGMIRFLDASGALRTDDAMILNSQSHNIEIHDDIRYQGKGMFRAGTSPNHAQATISINGSMRAVGVDGVVGGYPLTSAIGFVTSGNMNVGTAQGGSQLSMAALLYASGAMTIGKQTTILGSAVSGTMNAGQNVPRIAYAPGIEHAFPTPFPSAVDPSIPVRVAEERR